MLRRSGGPTVRVEPIASSLIDLRRDVPLRITAHDVILDPNQLV